MLIFNGKQVVTDHEERLVSSGSMARTFVAYDVDHGRPRHFAIGVTGASTYRELSAAIAGYFITAHHRSAYRAMCLDGGPSSQLAYLSGGTYQCPLQTGVAMPTAVAIERGPVNGGD